MAKSYHVVPNPKGGWDVKGGGAKKAVKHTETKQEAFDVARGISKNQEAELVVHNKNGQISQKDSHGHDPIDIPG